MNLTAPAPTAPATDAPTPPAPGAPLTDNAALPDPLDALHSALTLSPLQGAPHADLDALIAETAQTTQPAPFSLTLTADPAAIGGLLILGAGIGALAVLAWRRVTSPEARRARARSAAERRRFEMERERYEREVDSTLRAGARARGTATAAPMVVVDERPDAGDRP